MPGFRDVFPFGLTVLISCCLGNGQEVLSGTGFTHGTVATRTHNVGKIIIGNGVLGDTKSQREQPNLYGSDEQARFPLAETKLKRLGPSVRCGDDAMTLRVPGQRTPHFLVDRGDGSPVPISDIPASCGISVKRARRDVSLVAPYRGCHVHQHGGSFILPLLILGAPVQMSCPVSSSLPTVSCFPSGMVISLQMRAETVNIKVDGSWQPLLLTYSTCGFKVKTVDGALVVTAPFTGRCWKIKDSERQLPLLYGDREVTLSCPLTISPPADSKVPPKVPANVPTDHFDGQQAAQMFYPFPWWHYPPGVPTVPPTTTTVAPADPQQPMFPMPMFYPYLYPKDGSAVFPPHHPYTGHGFHHYPGYYIPTLPPPTTDAQPADNPQALQYPSYPMFPQFPYFHGFKDPEPTTTPVTPDQHPQYPQMYQAFQYPFMPRLGPRSRTKRLKHRSTVQVSH